MAQFAPRATAAGEPLTDRRTHDVPYYGKADQALPLNSPAAPALWVCRGAAQQGTTRFYRCATAYLLLHNQRWTLAVTLVHPQDSLTRVLQRLLAQLQGLGLRRDGSRHQQWLLDTLIRCRWPAHSLPRVRQRYRRRFGIESSYRLLEQVRLRTTSPNEALRFLAIGLALMVGNVWIALHWHYLRVRAPGRPRVARQEFTLEQMARFLIRAVEAIYGVITSIHAPPYQIGIY